jgi:hypothetical protein
MKFHDALMAGFVHSGVPYEAGTRGCTFVEGSGPTYNPPPLGLPCAPPHLPACSFNLLLRMTRWSACRWLSRWLMWATWLPLWRCTSSKHVRSQATKTAVQGCWCTAKHAFLVLCPPGGCRPWKKNFFFRVTGRERWGCPCPPCVTGPNRA